MNSNEVHKNESYRLIKSKSISINRCNWLFESHHTSLTPHSLTFYSLSLLPDWNHRRQCRWFVIRLLSHPHAHTQFLCSCLRLFFSVRVLLNGNTKNADGASEWDEYIARDRRICLQWFFFVCGYGIRCGEPTSGGFLEKVIVRAIYL